MYCRSGTFSRYKFGDQINEHIELGESAKDCQRYFHYTQCPLKTSLGGDFVWQLKKNSILKSPLNVPLIRYGCVGPLCLTLPSWRYWDGQLIDDMFDSLLAVIVGEQD